MVSSFSVTLPESAAATSDIDAFSSVVDFDPSYAKAYFGAIDSTAEAAKASGAADFFTSSTVGVSGLSAGTMALGRVESVVSVVA